AMTEDEIFPPMMVRMVSAGEEAGQPGEILDRYAVFMQNEIEHTRALQSALAYPCVLVGLASILLVALVMFLTPIIKDMYDSTGSELPFITQCMVGLGAFLHNWGLITLIAAVVIVVLVFKSMSRLTKDRIKLKLPIFGSMIKAGLMARWARTLAMLQGAGVPLLRSLQMSREVLDNEILTRELRRVETDVERGESISAAIRRVYLIPPLLQQFLKTGERTGSIEPMLNSAASFYERELARARVTLIRWLEPCLIVFMGIIVGLLVVSALLPLSELSSKL
ncbi:type II secretion system F family protein, partial [bacterium]|nr:type II secretion system F family protein [bacterium]